MKRFLHIVASAIGFGSLGVLGSLFSLFAIPVMRLLPGGRPALQRRTRSCFFLYFRALVGFLSWAGIFDLTTQLPPRAEMDGHLVLATHPGYLDVVMLQGTLEQLTCVVKPSIWNNPLFGWAVRAAGYIPALDPEWVLEEGAKALARGETIVLFPEGTRTDPGQPYRFQRGAAHLLLRSGAPVLPVIVTSDPPLLAKGHRWYHMPEHPCDYRIRALAPLVPPRPLDPELPAPQAARDLTEWLESAFNKEVYGSGHHPSGDQALHREDA
ncbi:MAG TPA: lysophospholipid acyltransferase family protein [Holophagaceae bacterium]|nr:lysophospholipid acyltransferase family protein [Holophagaceae bacterium]